MIVTHLLLVPLFQKIMYCSWECYETPGSDLSLDHLPRGVWGQCVCVLSVTQTPLSHFIPLKIQVGSLPTFLLFILAYKHSWAFKMSKRILLLLICMLLSLLQQWKQNSSLCLKGQGWIKEALQLSFGRDLPDGMIFEEVWSLSWMWHMVLSAWFLWRINHCIALSTVFCDLLRSVCGMLSSTH